MAGTEPASHALTLLLSCPKCGGPLPVDDEAVSATCGHCGSLLVLTAPDRDELYVADVPERGRDWLLDVYVLYLVQSHRADVVSRYQDSDGNPPSEEFIEARLRTYEREVRASARVHEARCYHAPYWHLTGAIVQGILGRRRGGDKRVRVRSFFVDHTAPAYDTTAANMRDRGLRLGRARVRPLTVREVTRLGLFLPFAGTSSDSIPREIERWKSQDLDPGLEPVAKHAHFVAPHRTLVYRPYWLVHASAAGTARTLLVDGSFGTIAGYPEASEVRALGSLATPDPLRSEEEAYRRVSIAASRCPNCGAEQRFDPRSHAQICASCHLALELGPEGARIRPSSHAAPASGDADFLPFWRFELEVDLGGTRVSTLDAYARTVIPGALPPGAQPRGRHLFVPAFRLLGTEIGDDAFKALSEAIHATPPEVADAKVPLDATPRFWNVTVPEPEARTLAPFALLALHGKAAAARLNALTVRKSVSEARITLHSPMLALLPFRAAGDALEAFGMRLPRLLLAGGPALDAQRVTASAARAGASRRTG